MASIYNMNTAEQFELGKIIEFPSVKQEKAKKRSGKKSEVYNYQPDDLVKMMAYLEQTENWIHWLIVAVQCNTARRISDTLALRWSNIYNPATGNYRTEIEIAEKKTGKVGTPAINDAVKQAIGRYISETNCDPSKDNYSHFVFEQLSGNFKGKVITPAGHRKALKKAAQAVGIEYNVGTHSARKTFGAMSRSLHPNDYDSMEILATTYNHSSERVTKRYIGLTKEKVNQYYEDFGAAFTEMLAGKMELSKDGKPTATLEISDLRDIVGFAYDLCNDGVEKADAVAMMMDLIHSAAK